jgi:hypothetical protein
MLCAADATSFAATACFLIGEDSEVEGRAKRDGQGSDGQIKRTGVRWLPAVAKGCLHIGFCTLRSRLDSTTQGAQLAAQNFLFLISSFQAMALTMCVNEKHRCFFAMMRVDTI